jgi:hypothetical protein
MFTSFTLQSSARTIDSGTLLLAAKQGVHTFFHPRHCFWRSGGAPRLAKQWHTAVGEALAHCGCMLLTHG